MPTYSLTLRSEKGSKLTPVEMDNNLLYLQSTGGAPSIFFITSGDSGMTVSNINSIIFGSMSTYTNVYLPNPSDSIGQPICFIKTDNGDETILEINGIMFGGVNYGLYGQGKAVTFVSDGSQYWVSSTH